MKTLIGFLLFLTSLSAQATLIDRIQLEDAIKSRVESVVFSYDNKAKVLVRLDFKSFDGVYPGTSIPATDSIAPMKIESSDVSKAHIEVYSEYTEFNTEIKDLIIKSLPIQKSIVSLDFKTIKDPMIKGNLLPLDSQTFSEVSSSILSDFRNMVSGTIFVCAILALCFMMYQHNAKMNEFKKQMIKLAQAFSENSSGGGRMLQELTDRTQKPAELMPSFSSDSQNKVVTIPSSSLLEIFADAYWCQEDNYAHWLWKSLSIEQQKYLLNNLVFMKDYVTYFVKIEPRFVAYHEHPYYVEPLNLSTVSQTDLSVEVKKQWELWHNLSPIRQQHLPLTLKEKVIATQTGHTADVKWHATRKSELRTLYTAPTLGNISLSDEEVLCEQPELVPTEMRKYVKSLVWLSLKSDDEIKQILTKYDARTLANAWAGPTQILKRFEGLMPEKKLSLVKSFVEKGSANRDSLAYHTLVKEGFNDAA